MQKTASIKQNHRWWVLAVIAIAQLMVVLDSTVVNIALPTAQAALKFSNADRQWIVTGYALSFGSLVLLGGRVADLIGRKRVFITGLLGFATASAIGGASVNFTMLVSSRVLQGVFGAMLAPSALSLLTTTFRNPSERGKAFGIFGAIAGGGAAVGLLLGGFLTQYFSWRWSLYINLVFALVATFGAMLFLEHDQKRDHTRIDIPGTLAASSAVFSLVYGFSHAETSGWASPITIGFLVAGVALLSTFVLVESKVKHPLLPLRVITNRVRAASYTAVFLTAIGMFAIFLFLTYFMQLTLGFSPVKTGLAFMPMVAALVLSATLSTSVLLPKIGPKPLILTGSILAAIGLMLLTRISPTSSYAAVVLPGLLVLGLGMGSIFSPAINTATDKIDSHDAGVASALVNTSQQIGGSIGTSLLNTLAASTAAGFMRLHATKTATVLAEASVHSYITAFRWAALIFVISAFIILFTLKWGTTTPKESGSPLLPDTEMNYNYI